MTEEEYRKKLKNKLITYRNSLNLPHYVTFGIEIEYENVSYEEIEAKLYELAYDDERLLKWKSVIEPGISEVNNEIEMNGEITSPILYDDKNTWETIEKVLDFLLDKGATVTNSCGGHVNIGAHIFENNYSYIQNFVLLWILYSNEIYKFSTGEFNDLRERNLFIQQIEAPKKTKKLLSSSMIEKFNKWHEVYIYEKLCDEIVEGNRVEFRVANGTLKKEIWQNYINFFSRLLLLCRTDLDKDLLLYKIKKHKSSIIELANLVFDSNEDKESFLIQSLKTNKVYQKELVKHITYN